MELIKLTQFCKHHGHNRAKVNKMVATLGIPTHMIGRAKAVTLADATTLLSELELPDELQVKIVNAFVLQLCRNKRYVYAKVDGFEGKRPVLIPRRYHGKLNRKRIKVEVIEDKDGVSFRHEDVIKYGR